MELELREVDDAVRAELVRAVVVADDQLQFVNSVAVSIAQVVVDAIVEIVRANGGSELFTSYVDEPGGPGPFCARLGFAPAGDHDGEVLVVKHL